jgi:Copine/C2 domain
LYFSARNLKDTDWIGKSDPQVRLSIKNNPTASTWTAVGKTEEIKDNLNPDFKTTIEVFYQFEIQQTVRIEVVDMDGKDSFEQIGYVDVPLGTLASAKQNTWTGEIFKNGDRKSRGKVIVRFEALNKTDHEVHFKPTCQNLPMTTSCLCMSSIQPYIVIDKSFKAQGKDNFITIAKTEVSTNQSPSPVFKPMKFKAQNLCNSNFDQIVQFKIYTKDDENAPATLIGTVKQSMNFFVDGKGAPILNESGQPTGGLLKLDQFKIIEKPTFIEYLQSGWGISMQTAIDFTGSNEDFTLPHSLHYLGAQNQYEHALRSVGGILESYDSDRSYPVYGFGAIPKFMGGMHVSHCFPLNGNPQNPEIVGVEGILAEYRQKLPAIQFRGPTLFANILQ